MWNFCKRLWRKWRRRWKNSKNNVHQTAYGLQTPKKYDLQSAQPAYIHGIPNTRLNTSNVCMICFLEMTPKQKRVYTTQGCKCNPCMHEDCFNRWYHRNSSLCPICKKYVTIVYDPSKQDTIINKCERDETCELGCVFCMSSCLICLA
jgi:hypothetical protein